MAVDSATVRAFWEAHPCGAERSRAADRRQYFAEIEHDRYARACPHIPEIARFERFAGRDVLEVGCGLGTDGLQFAHHGARYVGIDLTPAAIALARERFALLGMRAEFHVADGERLPFPDASFDHVYSFGVIHHAPDPAAIVREIRRVLRPGGTVCAMVYNRASINYHVEIMGLRRLLRVMLRPSFMPALFARVTGLPEATLRGHRELLLRRPRMSREEWVSANTDGPACPLARVYTRAEALALFGDFAHVRTVVRAFDRSHWPILGHLLPDTVADRIGRRWGWHRIIYARK